jgi:hypothetical protein
VQLLRQHQTLADLLAQAEHYANHSMRNMSEWRGYIYIRPMTISETRFINS